MHLFLVVFIYFILSLENNMLRRIQYKDEDSAIGRMNISSIEKDEILQPLYLTKSYIHTSIHQLLKSGYQFPLSLYTTCKSMGSVTMHHGLKKGDLICKRVHILLGSHIRQM